ncbi:hypothetical protein AOC06_03830 [Polynucleobacter paludilacus]|uniref:hypothetical protein n=1 Tax=Polynucleobacter paludilacus TaxID=1855895 RepID=UPI001BFE7145|nr:hypothetical protein [Polynucleobacter paludilacus]QWD87706.1 hypothetical protein AOC06_03830 [Polynucleobacter paludilacus]
MAGFRSLAATLVFGLGSAAPVCIFAAGPGGMGGGPGGRGGPNPADVYPIVVPYGDCSSNNCNNYNQPLTPVTVPTGPNGATQTQVGTTTYYTPGGSSVTNGNQTIYSNGTNCVVNGNQKVCN